MLPAQRYAQRLGARDFGVEVFDEDIVVAAVLHLCKRDGLAPAPHPVEVHQLRVRLPVAPGDAVGQGVGRVC